MWAISGADDRFVELWRADADAHEHGSVSAVAHTPALDGLPGGDGHLGWLVSASENLLNLWECGSGRGAPALQACPVQRITAPSHILCEHKAALHTSMDNTVKCMAPYLDSGPAWHAYTIVSSKAQLPNCGIEEQRTSS